MPQQTIKFTIKQDGTVTEEVIGALGNECESLTKNIEEKLGVVQRVEHKPEYYQQKQRTCSSAEDFFKGNLVSHKRSEETKPCKNFLWYLN